MLKKIIIFVLTISMMIALSSCNNKESKTSDISGEEITVSNKSEKLKVMVSFNPLKEFTEAVGGDKVEVQTMIAEGTEPHDFEPKARDIADLNKAKVFVYNGLGMENWVDKVVSSLDNKELIIVEATKGCNLIENSHKEEEEETEEHEHGKYDPHTWLSLQEAKIEAANIKDALVKADPSNKDYYENNYREFSSQLDGLYTEYKGKFNTVSSKHFVTGHAAFGYLCREFGLEQNSVEDVFAEGEPTPKKLQELVEYSKKNNVKTIFVEDMVSPKVSETLANEIGGRVEKIYTIESREDNKNYIETMRDNLEKIYMSLK